jgi:GTP-binding protein
MFVDHIRIQAKAGNGGDGSAHFYRGKFQPKGGPDGGDGGDGGDIVLEVDPSTDSLRNFFFNHRLKAEHGDVGRGNTRSGRSGEDSLYKVPAGLVISRIRKEWNEETREMEDIFEPVADLTENGQRFILCKGGKGGKGNTHFKTSTHQAPREFTPGEDGEEGEFYFELRSIADAGLVGFPNAGKSTLLSKLSAAKPKIANYPFTTLQPHVGVMDFGNFRRGTVADIPGLIEGAHENIGLGHDFLRHIQRCRLLMIVVDTAGSEGRDPVEDIQTLRKELRLYSEELAERPWLILANKMDLPESEEYLAALRERFNRVPIFPISANEGTGMPELVAHLDECIGRMER